jgi:hypothetical protein
MAGLLSQCVGQQRGIDALRIVDRTFTSARAKPAALNPSDRQSRQAVKMRGTRGRKEDRIVNPRSE